MNADNSKSLTSIKSFFEHNPVFTIEEFRAALGKGRSEHTLHTHLKRYRASSYIESIKPGVYVVHGLRGHPQADEYMVAAKMAEDAVLAYHTAYDLRGFGHSLFHRIYYLTTQHRREQE